MMDVESIDLADKTPEVDAAEQRLAVAVEDESGLDTTTSTRLKPVVVFVHVLNADGNLIWAELPSHMGFRGFAWCKFSWHRPISGGDQETTAASCGVSELMREARASPRGPIDATCPSRNCLRWHCGTSCRESFARRWNKLERPACRGDLLWDRLRRAEIERGGAPARRGHLAISRVRSLGYRLSRLTPQPPGNVRWRSMRSPPERVCTPDKPTVTEIVLSD
jgi:hypothetical protein